MYHASGMAMVLTKPVGFLRRLFRPGHDYLPGTTIFRDIDIELVAGDLKLEECGERDGSGNLPASDSSTLAVTENAVARKVRQYWDEAAQGARRAHESLSGRWASLSSEAEIDTLLAEPKVVASTLSEVAREGSDRLEGLYRTVGVRQLDLERFREAEGITRPHHPPRALVFKLLPVVVAFAIELAINVSAFANGEEFGLAGAMFKVIALPFLNFGITAVLVFAFGRHVVRRPAWAKIIGALGFFVAVLWALFFNLTISHWRDSLGTQMSIEAGRTAWAAMMSNPFGLADLNSWLLFLAGLGAGLLGGVEAWIWKDPHPGYSRRLEALHTAEEDYNEARAWFLARLGQISTNATSALRDALTKAATAAQRRPELAAQASALAEDLNLYRQHLQGVADDLVAIYREANVRTRSTPPPEHFGGPQLVELPPINLAPLPAPDKRRRVPGLLKGAMEKIGKAKDHACSELHTLTERSTASGAT